MRSLLGAVALVALLAGPALANPPSGGISGYVTDAQTGKPVSGATVLYYRGPYVENATQLQRLTTNGRGFFSDITVPPGQYVIMVPSAGTTMGCAVDDVFDGESARVNVKVGLGSIRCSGPRIHPTLVDPNATADVYRI